MFMDDSTLILGLLGLLPGIFAFFAFWKFRQKAKNNKILATEGTVEEIEATIARYETRRRRINRRYRNVDYPIVEFHHHGIDRTYTLSRSRNMGDKIGNKVKIYYNADYQMFFEKEEISRNKAYSIFFLVFGIFITVSMLLSVITPYLNFNWMPKEETPVVQDITKPKTFFESTDWEGLEEKDFKLQLYSISQPPFNPIDLKDHVASVSAYCSTQNDNIGNYEYSFNTLIDGTKYMTSHYDTKYGHSVELKLIGGEELKIFLTSDGDNSGKQNVKDAFNNGNYFYFADSNIDKLLNIDMQETSSSSDYNATPLLEKIVEQLGKPSRLNNLSQDQDDLERAKYEMVYERTDFILLLEVSETPSQILSQPGQIVSISAKVFTPNSWTAYCNHLQKNN